MDRVVRSLVQRLRQCRPAERGFVLPAVLVGLVIMAVIAVGALAVAGDEARAARAMRESALAFYAAEAGLHASYSQWDAFEVQIEALAPGDSIVLGWNTLAGGDRYRTVIQRFDNGGQPIYGLRSIGRSRGPRGAERTLSFNLTTSPGAPLKLGLCCNAALTIRGDVDIGGGGLISGIDAVPPGWESECEEPTDTLPGLITDDSTRINITDGDIIGQPPIVQDTTINDSAFDEYGEETWDQIKLRYDHALDADPEIKADGLSGRPRIEPTYTTDPITGETVCDVSNPYNWGSNVPGDPCYDYIPTILIQGEVEVHEGYGQAVIIIDWDESKPPGEKGGEFELETNFEFNGVILGKGCVEIQKGAVFHGAVFVDSDYRNEQLCAEDRDYDMNKNAPEVHWSQCVVDRTLGTSQLSEVAEPDPGDAKPLPFRAFVEEIG